MKEIHFYERELHVPADVPYCKGWYETKQEIQNNVPRIITTQMGLMSLDLIDKGYQIFVHPAEGDSYEIKLGSNTCTDKEIRRAHNIFKMWEAGAFCLRTDEA